MCAGSSNRLVVRWSGPCRTSSFSVVPRLRRVEMWTTRCTSFLAFHAYLPHHMQLPASLLRRQHHHLSTSPTEASSCQAPRLDLSAWPLPPPPHRAPPPGIDAHLRPPDDQAGIRPLGGVLHPQGAQVDIRPLGGLHIPDPYQYQARTLGHQRWVFQQVKLIREGKHHLMRARALARQVQLQLQARLAQAQQPRHVQPQQQPARSTRSQAHSAQEAPVCPAGKKHVRDDTSSSGGRDSAQVQMRRAQQRAHLVQALQARQSQSHGQAHSSQAQAHLVQQPALPVQVQPQVQQPSRPVQVPVLPAARKRFRDDTSSSGSQGRGR